jgi:hypothetical protein
MSLAILTMVGLSFTSNPYYSVDSSYAGGKPMLCRTVVTMVLITASATAQDPRLCSMKTVGTGMNAESALKVVPCVWTPSLTGLGGYALTSIKSNPSGADVLIDGVVLAKTPTTLILKQRGDSSKSVMLELRKDGYEGGFISAGDRGSLFIELRPSQSGGMQGAATTANPSAPIRSNVPAVAQRRCPTRAWTNAFQPEVPVFPKATDLCPADEGKPLFTREGTLGCPSPQALLYAASAMDHSWRYAGQIAAVDSPVPAPPTGQSVSAAYYGCTIYHDGTALVVGSETSSFTSAVKTNVGWLFPENLRN